MSYRSDVTVVVKLNDYKKLWENFKYMYHVSRDLPMIGKFENEEYALFSFNNVIWNTYWQDGMRKVICDTRNEFGEEWFPYAEEQGKIIDELKKFDFYNFIRIGEAFWDHEKYYSNNDKKLIRYETNGEYRFVVANQNVFDKNGLFIETGDSNKRMFPNWLDSTNFDVDDPSIGKYFLPINSAVRKKDGSLYCVNARDEDTHKVMLDLILF